MPSTLSPPSPEERQPRHQDATRAPHEQPWRERALSVRIPGALSSFVELYIADYLTQHANSFTAAYAYKRFLRKLAMAFPDFGPGDFTKMDLQRFVIDSGAGLAPRTRKLNVTIIKGFFQWLHENEAIPTNPAVVLRAPKVPPAPPRHLEPKDIRALLKAAKLKKDYSMETLIGLGAYAGLRRGSMHSLRWEDIDFQRGEIHVRHAKNEKHIVVPLADTLRDILVMWRARTSESDCPYVLAHYYRGEWKPLYYTTTNKRFRVIVDIAGLPKTTAPHDLRRTFATMLHQDGIPIEVISRLLGHSDISTTLNHYAFTSDKQKRAAIGKLQY